MSEKLRSLILLVLAQVFALSLWFSTAAILQDLIDQDLIGQGGVAALSSAVQAGFVVGALVIAILGVADRYDPRRLFAVAAISGAILNLFLLVVPIDGGEAILIRFGTGIALAGVYPIGMKMAAAWGVQDRGFLVALLVGALTLGSASPHLVSLFGGSEWQFVVFVTSAGAFLAAAFVMITELGPYLGKAVSFNSDAVVTAWTNKRVRYAYLGYLGHMIELYAMWAWLAFALSATLIAMNVSQAEQAAKIITFAAIAAGAIGCVLGGIIADRVGKAQLTIGAMVISGVSALAFAFALHGHAPIWCLAIIAILWGVSIVPDSPQFSALVADHAPPDQVGSLLTLQTALGFTITTVTVQTAPILAYQFGWPLVMGLLAIGPLLGILAMIRFIRHDRATV